MNTSTKIFATLSMSAALGKKIQESEDSETIKGLGKSLYEAGFEATGKYPFPGLKIGKCNQISSAVVGLLSSPKFPPDILSMLIAGLTDIHAKCKPERQEIIDPVIYCAQACLDEYSYEPDHEAAFENYLQWVSA